MMDAKSHLVVRCKLERLGRELKLATRMNDESVVH